VNRRILLCALAVGAFALILALTSPHHDPHTDAAPSTHAVAETPEPMTTPTGEVAPAAAPAVAMNPAIAPPPEEEQSEPQSQPNSAADVDHGETENGKMLEQRDRGTERSGRAR
jgi:hypothetical protein